MTRIALIAILICTISGAAFISFRELFLPLDQRLERLSAQHRNNTVVETTNELGTIFYARQTISRGSVINMSDLSTERVSRGKIPLDTVQDFAGLANRVARCDIPKGQIISTRELLEIKSLPENGWSDQPRNTDD